MGLSRGGFGEGIITATLQETFEPLHTGHSLVFTIAPNGHVWGKRLDEKSGKNDVEVEIFAPVRGGYLFQQIKNGATIVSRSDFGTYDSPKFTLEQDKKITMILSQKERIYYLLGTLILRSHEVSLVGDYHHWDCRWKDAFKRPPIINPDKLPYAVKIVDCSYVPNEYYRISYWNLGYNDFQFEFVFSPRQTLRCKAGGPLAKPGEVLDFSRTRFMTHFKDDVKEYPRVEFFAARAENKKFDLRSWQSPTLAKAFKPDLKIMYGEYDLFDYFEIDDAVLLLEEERTSETESKFYWTIGVAQNKLIRNLARLKSNNDELRCDLPH